jgi:hypothetical protein
MQVGFLSVVDVRSVTTPGSTLLIAIFSTVRLPMIHGRRHEQTNILERS